MNATASDDTPSPEDHAYFLTIERKFLGLRRKAALLTAGDWQEAQGWHRQGIPVELVQDVMEKLFERQQARKGRTISGLRYFRAAVDAAWAEMLALKAGGRAEEAAPLPVALRLANLVARLPAALPQRERWVAAIAAIQAAAGPANEAEVALRALDGELVLALRAGLGAGERQAVDAQVEQALARLHGRLAKNDLAIAGQRLADQLLRRRFDSPMLSLFSPEARGEGDASEPPEPATAVGPASPAS
ncbi:MAG: hypothetical protein ABI689_05225 [Thermoanaerobaculia bacterium]